MENNKNKKVKLIQDIAILIIIFLPIFFSILSRETTNLDEIWNYNIARNIANGLVPYKDISMITTPFMYIIEAIILKVTFNEMIIARILTAILSTAIIFMIYKIIEKMTKNRVISGISSMIVTLLCLDYFVLDYNYTVLLLALIIIYKEISKKSGNGLAIGILAGLAICTKQTIGTAIAIICILEPIIINIKQKADKKEVAKNIAFRILGILIPINILIIYLAMNGAIKGLISYCIQGVKYFTNTISYSTLFEKYGLVIHVLAIILPIISLASIIECIIIKKQDENTEKLKLLTIYSIPMILTIYPIADDSHFIVAGFVTIILLIYQLWVIGKQIEKVINQKYKKVIEITLATFFTLVILYEFTSITIKNIQTYDFKNINNEIAHFKYLNMPSYLKNRIEKVNNIRDSYSENDIYILDSDAALYDIAEEKYYKNYDMFNKGNLGKYGECGIIKQIEKAHKKYYMIRKQTISANWQTPTQVTKYIRDNLEEVGEVDMYEIYYKE